MEFYEMGNMERNKMMYCEFKKKIAIHSLNTGTEN
jgi:hypothetical protein